MKKLFYLLLASAILLPASVKAHSADEPTLSRAQSNACIHSAEAQTRKAAGQPQDEFLVIYMEDQSKSAFLLDEYPVITFDDDSIVVSCQGTQLTIAYAAVADIAFVTEDGTPTTIGDISLKDNGNPQRPHIKSGEAYFTDLEPGSDIHVHDMQGHSVAIIHVGSDGTAVVNLRALPKGVYILATKNYSYKIVNP